MIVATNKGKQLFTLNRHTSSRVENGQSKTMARRFATFSTFGATQQHTEAPIDAPIKTTPSSQGTFLLPQNQTVYLTVQESCSDIRMVAKRLPNIATLDNLQLSYSFYTFI